MAYQAQRRQSKIWNQKSLHDRVDCKQDTKNSKTKPDTIGRGTYNEGYGLRNTLLEWVASPSLCVIIRNSIGAPTWVYGVNGSTTRECLSFGQRLTIKTYRLNIYWSY